MGCLNDEGKFSHWFGNIHLSGPCNRRCYFCIGQHMMALDQMNTLDRFPLPGLDEFIVRCASHKVKEVYLTGSNTEPMLYRHHAELVERLKGGIRSVRVGIRSNGIMVPKLPDTWRLYDKASITICSIDRDVNRRMMGGDPADIDGIIGISAGMDLKVNVVLGPENIGDVVNTLEKLAGSGVRRVNLREPYRQPHVGDPMVRNGFIAEGTTLEMPTYRIGRMKVTYWDVHYVEVESVNLYASGRISELYLITKGHDESGEVHSQEQFRHGRQRAQWQYG